MTTKSDDVRLVMSEYDDTADNSTLPKETNMNQRTVTDSSTAEGVMWTKMVHTLSLAFLQKCLSTHLNLEDPRISAGLSSEEAQKKLEEFGPNTLTPPKQMSELLKYVTKFLDPFMLLLQAAGVLCFIAYGLDTTQPVNMWVGVVLLIAVFISSTFTYIQEGKASSAMKSFKSMLPARARVLRNGQLLDILASEVVVGDIVKVVTGDQVPADIRAIYTSGVKVENSSLTGESMPVDISSEVSDAHRLEDARNVMFNTSKCLEGEAIGVVFATGDKSFIGQIAALASSTNTVSTPIQVEIRLFVRRLAVFAFTLGIIFLVIGLARGKPWIQAVINSFIIVVIACVPEGLPMTVVSCLTITAKKMASRNVFVKELRSVETLGSATVIASDKTGTLTQNKMSVVNFWFDQLPLTEDNIRRNIPAHLPCLDYSAPTVRKTAATAHVATYNLLELSALLCNRSRYMDERSLRDEEALVMERSQLLENLEPSMTLGGIRNDFPTLLGGIEGDTAHSVQRAVQAYMRDKKKTKREIYAENATDKALFEFIHQRQNVELIRYHYKTVFELPFNSRNKFSICIAKPHKVRTSFSTSPTITNDYMQTRYLFMKGAPEIILSRCSSYMRNGQQIQIDDAFRDSFQQAYETFGGHGERVLGFAWLQLDEQQFPPSMDNEYSFEKNNFPVNGLCFLGLISLMDPPKPSVARAVDQCRSAGIKVIMVTGDHALTAASIARQIGIIRKSTADQIALARDIPVDDVSDEEYDAIVVDGVTLDTFTEDDWTRVLSKSEIVFARTTPQQKLSIVEHLQKLDHIVAVTGDGVNDSPALKKADIGIAMGIMGTDVAKDASDVILMDDDFASIVEGIKCGRTIFDNLTKTIAYTVTHLVPETIPVLLGLAFDFPTTLPSLAILAIDCGTELAPAVSFAYEPSESDVMNRPPRNSKKDRLVSLKVSMYCIFQAGLISTLCCFMSFLLVIRFYGIDVNRLTGSSSSYFSPGSDNWIVSGDSGCDKLNPIPVNCVYFTDSQQVDINLRAACAYYATLTACQVLHIFACKTRTISLFQHGIFNNVVMIYGIIIEISLMCLFIFTPNLNELLVGKPFEGVYWLLLPIPGVIILVLTEIRKYLARNNPKGFVATYLNW